MGFRFCQFNQCPTLLALLIVSGLPGYAAALGIEPNSQGHLVQADNYQVQLTHSGALLSITDQRGMSVYPALPDRAAFVLRAGNQWISAPALWQSAGHPAPQVTATTMGLHIRYEAKAQLQGLDLQSSWEYLFSPRDHFAAQATLQPQSGPTVDLLAFPGPMAFPQDTLQEAIFPFQRGVVLTSEFFQTRQTLAAPIPAGFTDFTHLRTRQGSLTLSSMDPQGPALDHGKTLVLRPDRVGTTATMQYHSDRALHLKPGASHRTGWTLFQIQTPPLPAMQKHWRFGGGDQYPQLRQKLPPEVFERLSRSLLLKYPDGRGPQKFTQFTATLDRLPVPSLLHLCAYMPGGHDATYPDYLPPNPAWGTTMEMANLMARARSRGHLVMPYTNPTWWDPNSPTLRKLGPEAIALDETGQPRQESYGPRLGALVSPGHAGVRERIARTTTEMTQDIPSDLIFADQVGARSLHLDNNPGSLHPYAYTALTVRNAADTASRVPLMVEGATDHLARIVTAFSCHGALAWEQPPIPANTYHRIQLPALMANQHAATYPHNLAGEAMAHNPVGLRNAIAFGNTLAYDLNRGESPWLFALARLQREVVSRSFGQQIIQFEDLRPNRPITRVTFAHGDQVTANWGQTPIQEGSHQLAPDGFLWKSRDGRTLAGWLLKPDRKAALFLNTQGTWTPENAQPNLP